jgi:hypothetical protein
VETWDGFLLSLGWVVSMWVFIRLWVGHGETL